MSSYPTSKDAASALALLTAAFSHPSNSPNPGSPVTRSHLQSSHMLRSQAQLPTPDEEVLRALGLLPNAGASGTLVNAGVGVGRGVTGMGSPARTRPSDSYYHPLPTRSGRIPQVPRNPPVQGQGSASRRTGRSHAVGIPEEGSGEEEDGANRETNLFNELFNFEEYPSSDDEDPDFVPPLPEMEARDRDGGMDFWDDIVIEETDGGGMGRDGEGDIWSNDEDGDTDFSFDGEPSVRGMINTRSTLSAPIRVRTDDIHVPVASTSHRPYSDLPPTSQSNGSHHSFSPSDTSLTPLPRSTNSKRSRTRSPSPSKSPVKSRPPANTTAPTEPKRPYKKRAKKVLTAEEEATKEAIRKGRNAAHQKEARGRVREGNAKVNKRIAELEEENRALRERVRELSSAGGRERREERKAIGDEREGRDEGEEIRIPTEGGGTKTLKMKEMLELAKLLQWAAKGGNQQQVETRDGRL